jgi:hypothetical protein
MKFEDKNTKAQSGSLGDESRNWRNRADAAELICYNHTLME